VPLLLDALRVNRNITQQWHIANALEALAGIAANHGQTELGATLFGAIEIFREQAAAPLEPALQAEHDRAVAKLRSELGESAFAQAWEAGRAMPVDEAIAEAANVHPAGAPAPPLAATAQSSRPAPGGRPATSSAAEELGLTPREIDVLRLLAEGRSTADIAETLFISPRTVSTHVASILGKLGVPTRSAAVALALRSSLV
jgi:DNA-binding CsgD family transcriptional regulator